jgi:glyoxylase-like metal-dependent hydrolase (beta-lactamase superfamily II)
MKFRVNIVAMILGLTLLTVLSMGAPAAGQGGGSQNSGPKVTGKVYVIEKIADGVYYASSNGGPMATGGNHPIIVGDHDVFLVDAGATPAAGRALLEDLKLITDKPVRWVVNTHFHWDHTNANSIFGPEVQIIGHEYVRHAIADLDIIHHEPFLTAMNNMPGQVDTLKKQVADEKDPAKRATLEKALAAKQADWEEFKMLKPTPPTMTYNSKMTLYQGQREIQLLFLGRGHTQGDTFVYLPKERILCTGDMMESQPAYMGDALFDEWLKTLDAVKEMNFDTVLPGHGVPFHEKSLITAYQSLLRDFMSQATELRKQGLTPEQAAPKIDLTSHKADFPQIQGPGAEIRGVRRMYAWMDEKSR